MKEVAVQPVEESEFAKIKANYFSRLALRYLSHLRLHKEFHLLPKAEGWANVSLHCLLQAAAMEVLASSLGLKPEEEENLIIAALAHDFHKRREIELLKTEGDTLETYQKDEAEGADILRSHGYSPEVINIIDAIGITKMDKVIDSACPLPEKLMFLVDASTDDEEIVGARQKTSKMRLKHPDIAAEGTYDRLDKVTDQLEAELASRLAIDDPSNFASWLNGEIKARIMAWGAENLAGNSN